MKFDLKIIVSLVFFLLSVSLSAQESHFDSTTQILSVPFAVLDGNSYYEDVEIRLNQSTGKFDIVGGNPVSLPDGPYQTKLNYNSPRKLIFGNEVVFADVVGNDGRCPIGLECFQAGEVTVQLLLENQSGQFLIFDLSLPGSGVPETPGFLANNIYFRLLQVNPYPEAKKIVLESEYDLVLEYSLEPFQ